MRKLTPFSRPRFHTNEPTRCRSDVARMQAAGRNPGIPASRRMLSPDSATLDPGYIWAIGEYGNRGLSPVFSRSSTADGTIPIAAPWPILRLPDNTGTDAVQYNGYRNATMRELIPSSPFSRSFLYAMAPRHTILSLPSIFRRQKNNVLAFCIRVPA